DLKDYNQRHQNTDPSNGLRQYIKFHKSLKGIIENSTIITMEKNTMALNTILFGPPGTGKTFSSTKKALEIIDGAVSQDHSEAKQRFETLQESGQISMVTFHQSYGYEEFVEGLKANTVDGHISYDVEAGAFKIIAERALSNYESYEEASRNTIVKDLIDIELLLNDFSNFVSEELAQDKQVLLTVNGSFPNPSYIGVVNRFSDDNFRSFSTVGGATNQSLTKNIIIRDYQEFFDGKITDYKDIKPRYESQSSYHGNGIYYYELYCVLKDFQEQNPGKYIIKNKDIELKKYILIIDEINRGNISKIFGELITLIEPSKRIGASDEIRVNLPYSERENSFGIPSNLYIIGTMNTADRSIALLDTALRRRFNFIEMMPDIELIEAKVGLIDGIDVSNILQRINKRIEVLYDRDHMIGHAYFLDLKTFEDLVSVLKNKIIPLLQEYFYDDWQKITMVFNNNGFIKESSIDAEMLFSNVEYDFDDDQKIYSLDLKALEDPETYQKI
ncbi:MAG: AAA family ATPase, partial [Candidatus Cloacimonadota bacterium]|nr:AAA family ATPase [Candidatus Cloacimonadota bacterium]